MIYWKLLRVLIFDLVIATPGCSKTQVLLRSCFWHEVVICWGFKTFDGHNSQFCTTYLLLEAPKSAAKRMSVSSMNITIRVGGEGRARFSVDYPF